MPSKGLEAKVVAIFNVRHITKPENCRPISLTSGLLKMMEHVLLSIMNQSQHQKYYSSVWDPHTRVNIKIIEGVQRVTARLATDDYSLISKVTTIIQKLCCRVHEKTPSKASSSIPSLSNQISIPTILFTHPPWG